MDIVDRLRANTDKYPGFENMNTDAAAEIERLRARVADLEETVRFNEDQRRMLFDSATTLESERDSWKKEAIEARTWLADQRVSENGQPYETYAERIAPPSYWATRADINSASNALRILYANLKTATTAMERCGLTAMVDGIRADIVTEPCVSALSKAVPKEEI